jgi:hypothetical protein
MWLSDDLGSIAEARDSPEADQTLRKLKANVRPAAFTRGLV